MKLKCIPFHHGLTKYILKTLMWTVLNSQSDASKKRKSSEMEADGQMSAKRHRSMIETNQQFGAGRVEPEKEKNPQPEIEDENNEYVDRSVFNGKLYARQFKPTGKNDISLAGKQD